MQFLLLIHSSEAKESSMDQAEFGKIMSGFQPYTEALHKAGVFVGGDRLRPTSDATTVRVAGGKTTVLNGPYAETKEQLGGYYLIDVPDIAAANEWAAKCPGAQIGTMEVRATWPM
jgi:hypothetical protein